MKVVLFCGGLGTRLREQSETIPKPLVNIGYRPILWHLMKYYAHFGHNDFILCLGYRGDQIREFFLSYDERLSTDFTWFDSGKRTELCGPDISDWRVTFVDTGLHSNIGERLCAIRELVAGEEIFLANYSDGLSDYPLDTHVEDFRASDAIASFASVRPLQSFHAVHTDDKGVVTRLSQIGDANVWFNGGFFIFRQQIFDYIRSGEELVEDPFQRLIAERKLISPRHSGFWRPMDTLKDKIAFDRMYARGNSPWELWEERKPNSLNNSHSS